jgi:hypothetical protein
MKATRTIVRVAHASRVSGDGVLAGAHFSLNRYCKESLLRRGRRNQHARRVRYPNIGAATRALNR